MLLILFSQKNQLKKSQMKRKKMKKKKVLRLWKERLLFKGSKEQAIQISPRR
jgi:hypothetical protein